MKRNKKGGMRNGQLQALCGLLGVVIVLGLPLAHYYGYEEGKSDGAAASIPTITPTAQETADQHPEWTLDNLSIRFNEMRLSNGLRQMYNDTKLDAIAQKDMAGNCPVTGHDGFRKQETAGLLEGHGDISEVLTSGESTPKEAVDSLLTSPDHKDIMLQAKFTHLGVGFSTVNGTNCVSFVVSEK